MAAVTEPTQILDVLRKLQAIDDDIRDVREGRDSMLGNLTKLNSVLEERDAQLIEMREKLGEAETWYAKKTNDLDLEKDKLQKAKVKLNGVSRSREYVAVNRELDNIRKNIGHREDEIERLNLAIEEFRSTIEVEDEKVKDLRSAAESEEITNRDALSSMDERIGAVNVRREAIVSQIDRRLVRRYDKIFKARDSVAVVAVIDGACGGCQMNTPPRLIEAILRGSSLVQCPYCNRYLFQSSGHDEDGEAEA
ncbi:MAG TPA: hypothetical protein DCQ06_08280 [Myxococcales bacterium]|nr:hypothetical protein [Myxococcales bacterium]HAN31581.1 hypothetical protein [Myxococcales bacterium]